MFHTTQNGGKIDRDIYYDKILGCWAGKNIGGTLGAPFEFCREVNSLDYYSVLPQGEPEPNDDLDLQFIWLNAIEDHGVYGLDQNLLGEYFLTHLTAPWNEYGVALFNLRNGFMPPLSGICNNQRWQNSNGAWIRAEIWACLFPGEPDEAMPLAWIDASIDHAGEGIWAELFIVALEACAFVENDPAKLIDAGLTRIPADCEVSRCVRLVYSGFKAGEDWLTVRNRVVAENTIGWFMAPSNIAFVVIGLLWGGGDFGKSICIAVNCGDDTDCTGATCGAILGIMIGRKGLPERWTAPVGEKIRTVAVNTMNLRIPRTIIELADRIMVCKQRMDFENPTLLQLGDANNIPQSLITMQNDNTETAKRVWGKSNTEMRIGLPFGWIAIDYGKVPEVSSGEKLYLKLTTAIRQLDNCTVTWDWKLPDDWVMTPGVSLQFSSRAHRITELETELVCGIFTGVMQYIPVEIKISNRHIPFIVMIPFQLSGGAAPVMTDAYDQTYWDELNRFKARIKFLGKR